MLRYAYKLVALAPSTVSKLSIYLEAAEQVGVMYEWAPWCFSVTAI